MTTNQQTPGQDWRYELRNRYLFRGRLVMETGLHIGGGKDTLSNSDSPIVLTPDQKPYIPGSSFKGALRSATEKLAANLPGFTTCALIPSKQDELQKAIERMRRGESQELCSTNLQSYFVGERRAQPERAEALNAQALAGLCDTCRLFGSPFAAAHLNLKDLTITSEEWGGLIQRRDGVAIDRDSEKARDRLKFDYEVVPASAAFELEIVLENATPQDLQLTCVGLSEYVHGFGVIGGKRSRGLGVAKLEGLKVHALDLENEQTRRNSLRDYLLKGEKAMKVTDGEAFLEAQINAIFE